MKARGWIVTVGAGLALADASIVTLALPELLRALDTTVEGVAAVIVVYTLVLAAALLPAERLARRFGAPALGAAGFALFAAASVACAAADSLTVLLVARGVQALGGAAGLVAAFVLISGGTPLGRRHWLGAAVLAAAVGPALGGALTQAFDWRAIFVMQIPIAAAGAVAALRGGVAERTVDLDSQSGHGSTVLRGRVMDQVALALVSAALTAVLFGLVLLLIAGWAVEPLAAAATVTVLPLAALAGARMATSASARGRAVAGSLLVGGGVLALAWLPGASVAWTFAPQILAGVGMGMSLPAFAGQLLPERTAKDAAHLLTVRHVGIALVLIALAPILAHRLDVVTEHAQEQGVALVLDAALPPQDKLSLAPALLKGVEAERPRAGLQDALKSHGRHYTGSDRVAYDTLAERADAVLVGAVGDAFRIAFVIAGALGLLAAAALLAARPPRGRPLPLALLGLVSAVAVALPVAYVLLHHSEAPPPVVLQDPCKHRTLPGTGGISGFLQDRALQALDAAACRLHATREELVLGLADETWAKRFKQRYGVDPRSVTSLLGGLISP